MSIVALQDFNLLLLIEIVYKRLEAEMIERIHAAGYPEITAWHGHLFSAIGEKGSRIGEMATRAGISQQSMSEIVDDLEANGYVRRRVDPDDRRARIVELTKKGWASARVAVAAINDLEREWGSLIGPRKMLELRNGLVRLIERTAPEEE